MSNSRSREVRKLMAEMGTNYTKASLELERREAAQDVPTSEGFALHSDLSSAISAAAGIPDLSSAFSAAAGISEDTLAQATEAAASSLPPFEGDEAQGLGTYWAQPAAANQYQP